MLVRSFPRDRERVMLGAPMTVGNSAARAWATKFEMRSPRYTTRLDELPVVRA